MSVPKFEVEKFDGSNDFSLWKLKVQALLDQQGLGKALEGESKLPEALSPDKKEEIMAKARSTIQLSLADNVLREVMGEKTADSLWTALEEKYSVKTLSNQLYQRKRLYTFKYSGEKPIRDHIDDFNRMITDVQAAGIAVEDIDQAMILLTSLPPSYDNFCDTIMYGRSSITVKTVKEALMTKEQQKLASGSSADNPADGLFVTRGRSQERGSESRSKRRSKSKNHKSLKCFHCHQPGHIRRNCPERKKSDSANVTIESSEDSDAESALTVSINDSGNEWILDSGASFHMTPNRQFFSSYQKREGKVRLGDNRVIAVVGGGEVRVRLDDGTERIFQAWHVPELGRNLISLSALDNQGYKFSGEGGFLKVTKGSMVVMKGKLQGGIYILLGSTVIGTVAVLSSERSYDDATRLWHMRLGHMSEKGMTILAGRGLLKGLKNCKLGFCENCVFGK